MEKEEKRQEKSKDTLLAVIRVRGEVNLRKEVKETFRHLNLHQKNRCIILEETPSNRGAIISVKDYVTWGEISKESRDELFKKRGELFKERTKDKKGKIEYEKCIVYEGKSYKRYFRLSPPKKGYGRNGVKYGFNEGGALGYRGEKINDLIKRMI